MAFWVAREGKEGKEGCTNSLSPSGCHCVYAFPIDLPRSAAGFSRIRETCTSAAGARRKLEEAGHCPALPCSALVRVFYD